MCDIFTDCRWMHCFTSLLAGFLAAMIWLAVARRRP